LLRSKRRAGRLFWGSISLGRRRSWPGCWEPGTTSFDLRWVFFLFEDFILKREWNTDLIRTMKASNFGPHGNFEPFLVRPVASLGELCAKNEQNRLCKSKVCLKLLFHYSCFRRTLFCKPFWKNGPKFRWGPKLEALRVIPEVCIILRGMIPSDIYTFHYPRSPTIGQVS
jgi:hypothetical protein